MKKYLKFLGGVLTGSLLIILIAGIVLYAVGFIKI